VRDHDVSGACRPRRFPTARARP